MTETRSPAERDPTFLARLVARDREALGRFYELYFERIHGYVRRMVGDETLAEDVTQDVFLHLQRAIPTFDTTRELDPWVFTIATNKVRDLWRSKRHQHEGLRGQSLDDGDADDRTREAVDARPGPLPELESEELRATLSAAVDALPAGLRAAFVLRWHEELEFTDIGRILERNEAAARKRYSRALAELRRILEESARTSRRGA
ncbi:MAG: RNA polymerase sigma factor [Planctomycetota bacterium]|nr:RNA polymerase sigma factor [Planctomycetota bacterium]